MTALEARKHLFQILESGEAAKFIALQRQRQIKGIIAAKRFAETAYGAFAP